MDGKVNMKRFVHITSTCPIDEESRHRFPFDYHQCRLKFGSRGLTSHDLTIKVDKMNRYISRSETPVKLITDQKYTQYMQTIDFSSNPEWDFTGFCYNISNSKNFLREHEVLDVGFSQLEISLLISRNTPKLVIVIMIPAFCLVILSSVGLLIPVSSGEKLGYSVTILLAFYVYKEAVEGMVAPWENYRGTPKLIALFTGITLSK